MAGNVFCAKLHRPGGTSSVAALAVGGLDSIVLSAHDKSGNRIETMEFSLTENRVFRAVATAT